MLAATVGFNQSTYHINENVGSAKLTLILSNPLSFSISVVVLSTDGSARGKHASIFIDWLLSYMIGEGEDYGSGPYSVTIPAKATSVQFDVNIHDDNVLEMDENFTLTINISSLPDHVISTNSEATVTIVDDDGKYYRHG